MPEATRLVTAEELEKSPDDDYRYELVEGPKGNLAQGIELVEDEPTA